VTPGLHSINPHVRISARGARVEASHDAGNSPSTKASALLLCRSGHRPPRACQLT